MLSLIGENLYLTTQLNGKSIQKELNKIQKEKEQLNKSLEKQKIKNQQFLRSHNSLTSKVRELQKSLQSQKSQMSRSNLASKSIQVIKQHKNISATSSVISMSRYVRSEHRDELIQELKAQIAQLKKENQDQKSQIGKLNKEITDRNTILKDLSDRLCQLQQQEALLNNETCHTQQDLKLQKQAQKQVGVIQNQLKTKNYSFAKKSMQGFIKNYSHLVKFTNENSLYKFLLIFIEEIQKLKQIEKQSKVCQKNLNQAKRALIREKQLEQNLQQLKNAIRSQQQPLKEIEEILSRINNQYKKTKNWQRISIKKPSTQLSSSMQIIYVLLEGCKFLASENSNLQRSLESFEKNASKTTQFQKDLNSTIQLLKKCQSIIKKKQYLKDDSVWSKAIDQKKVRKDISSIFMQIVNMLLNQGKGIWAQQKKKLEETIQKLEADYKISQGRVKKLQQDFKNNRIQTQDLNNIIEELRERIQKKEQQQRQSRKLDEMSQSGSTHRRRFSRNSQEKVTSSRQQTPRSSMNASELMQGYIEQEKKMLQKISELQHKIQYLKEQNKALEQQLSKNIQQTKILQQEYLSQMIQIKKKLQNYKLSETYSEEIKAVQFKLSTKEIQLRQCQEELSINEEKFRKKAQQFIDAEEQLTHKKRDNIRFQEKIQEKDNLLAQSRKLYAGLQSLFEQRQRQISQLKQFITKLQYQSNAKVYSYETLNQNYSILQHNLQEKQYERSQLQRNYNHLENKFLNKNQQLIQIKNSYAEIQKNLINKESQIKHLNINKNDWQHPKVDFNNNYQEILKRNNEFVQQKHQLQHQLTIKVQEINHLKNLINKSSSQFNYIQQQYSLILQQLNKKQVTLQNALQQKIILEDKLSKLQRQRNKEKQNAQLFEKQLKYFKQQLSINQKSDKINMNTNHMIQQIIQKDRKIAQLMNDCDILKNQISQKIQKALNTQQTQFNQFLKKNDIERNNYYQNIIFPQWKKTWQLEQTQKHKIVEQLSQNKQLSRQLERQYKKQLQKQVQAIKLQLKKQKQLEINTLIQLKAQQIKKEIQARVQQDRNALIRNYKQLIEEKLIEKQLQIKNIKQIEINKIQQHYKQVINDLEQKNLEIMKRYSNISESSDNKNYEFTQKFQFLQKNYDQLLNEKKSIKKQLNEALSDLNRYKIEIENIMQQKSLLYITFEQKLAKRQNQLRSNYNFQIQRIKSYREQPLLKEKEEIILLNRIIDNQQIQLQQMRNFIRTIDSNVKKRDQQSLLKLSNSEDKIQIKIKNIQIDHTKRMFEIKSEYEIKVIGLQKQLQQYKRRYQQAEQKIQFTKRQLGINQKNILEEEKFKITSEFQKRFMQMEANLTIKENQIIYANRENKNLNEDNRNLKQNIAQLKSQLHTSSFNVSELKNRIYQLQYNSKIYQQSEISYKRQINILQNTAQQTKKQYQANLQQLKKQINEKASLLYNRQEISSHKFSQTINDKILLQNQINALKQQNKKYRSQLQKMNIVVKQNSHLLSVIEQIKKKSQKQFEQPYIGSAYQSNYTNSKRRIKEFYDDYDQSEMQALKRINQQVSDLVEANRKLQLKLSLYENSAQINAYNSDIINFFLILENRLEKLINYLLDNMMIQNSDSYKLFLQKSRKHLQTISIQQYFDSFQLLLKNLFRDAHELQARQMQSKAKQMMELKQQMSDILEKQILLNEEQNDDFSHQQKFIEKRNNGEHELIIQIKQLIQQYIDTRDQRILIILQTHLESVDNF